MSTDGKIKTNDRTRDKIPYLWKQKQKQTNKAKTHLQGQTGIN